MGEASRKERIEEVVAEVKNIISLCLRGGGL
jgi:hypothetical protein